MELWVVEGDGVEFGAPVQEITLTVPSTAQDVICVGAVKRDNDPMVWADSSIGLTWRQEEKPDLAAPGEGILAAAPNTMTGHTGVGRCGTSVAAPHVTGAVALALSKKLGAGTALGALPSGRHLRWSLNDAAMIANPTSDHLTDLGWGVLDVAAFVDTVLNESGA